MSVCTLTKTPEEDAKRLQDSLLPVLTHALSNLKFGAKPGHFKSVFLTGGTGFFGRLLLTSLLDVPNLTIYCMVRAPSSKEGLFRIQQGLEESRAWRDDFSKKIHVVVGDLCKSNLGLSAKDYNAVVNTDAIYHCASVSSFLLPYERLRMENTISLEQVLRLCVASKVKHLFFVSALGIFPAFFLQFGGKYRRSVVAETTKVETDELRSLFTPNVLGFPWSKWACEEALTALFSRGLPGAIFRIPPLWVGCVEWGFANTHHFATRIISASVEEALFPIGATTAPLTPADSVAQFMVDLSFNPHRLHRVYHLMNPAKVRTADMREWAAEIGLDWKGVPWSEFSAAVKRRGTSSPMHELLPFFDKFAQFWFDPLVEEAVGELTISTAHLTMDLPNASWPPLKSVFKRGFVYLLQRHVFPKKALSLYCSVENVLRMAHAISGLDDLGEDPDFFLEPMGIFLDSLASHDVTFMGQLATQRSFIQYIANLMYMVERTKHVPEIEQQEVASPVIIVGLNRSGTSFLQQLLCQDSQSRAPALCEMVVPYGRDGMYQPVGIPLGAPWNNDPRVEACQDIQNQQMGLSREFMALHSRRSAAPEEDFVIQEHCFRSYSFCVGFQLTSYRKWLMANGMAEFRKSYPFHKRFLQHLQWQRPAGERWLLKMPFHLLSLDGVFDVYPDARIIFCHRDPVAVVTSWCKLESFVQDQLLASRDKLTTGQYGLEILSSMINRSIAFRDANPHLADRFIDIQYNDFIQDPIATVKDIYTRFGWTLDKSASNRMWKYMIDNRALRPLMQKESDAAERERQRLLKQVEVEEMTSGQAMHLQWQGAVKLHDHTNDQSSDSEEESPEELNKASGGWGDPTAGTISPLKVAGIDSKMVQETFSSYTKWQSQCTVLQPVCGPTWLNKLRTSASFLQFFWSTLVGEV